MTSKSTSPSVDQLSLFADVADVEVVEPLQPAPPAADADAQSRKFAVDPANNVVLEASAGTGKTSVLVARYINLLKAGVDPSHILAITFTRKAAAEMRERIIGELRGAASRSELDRAPWVELRDRLSEIAISTIDAFCLSLLREFPLEADLDPGFGMADETEVPRLIDEALDRSLRILTGVARTTPDVALVLAQLGISRTREGLAHLLDRRLVAKDALDRFLQRGHPDLTSAIVCGRAVTSLHDVLRTVPGGLAGFLADGPARHPRWELFVREVHRLQHLEEESLRPGSGQALRPGSGQALRPGSGHADATLRGVIDRVTALFLTEKGKARKSGQIPPYKLSDYPTPDAARRHRAAVFQVAPFVENVIKAFNRDLNAILARGVRQMFAIAIDQYRAALEERSVLDFSDVLQRALGLLRQMDEFAQSRFRLEARYHHVLVDEFQDTSRAQWELVSLLVQSWGEGMGLASQPSIFVVGDRKQSIYRFRDAEVSVLQQAGRYIEGLRSGSSPRRSITRSFRALPELLQFVNDLFGEIAAAPPERPDDFSYGDTDRFPVDPQALSRRRPALGIAVSNDPDECARAVALEIQRILKEDSVRDRQTGVPRQARPGDIAVLFRSRASHREFEQELETRGIPTYVYKGLGFFDADETKDLTALIRYLANPGSNLRAAAFLRSRFIRLSDAGLSSLAPDLAGALDPARPVTGALSDEDRRVLECARTHVPGWLAQVDRVPPADLIEQIVRDTAYAFELRGPRRLQAWENLKKMRGLIRRIQNRGYATLMRIGEHIDSLTAGDESNAVIEALDAVNLMTVHAAKGLEFPIVFVVNMAKGASGVPKPVRVMVSGEEEPAVSIGPFVSEMDEAERVREKHESRRLLYVALTRARDRLYFSSALKDGVLAPGRGSLAEVLPPSIATLFARAGSAFPECPAIGWTSSARNTFELRICRAQEESPPASDVFEIASPRPGRFDRPAPLVVQTRRTVADPVSVPSRERTLGILTHRLLASSARMGRARSRDERIGYARRLVPDQHAISFDPDSLADIVTAAVGAYETLQTREEIMALFSDAQCVYEVPFSQLAGDTIVRGSIDCLIRRRSGGVVVLEFKTGSPRESHRIQLDQYLRAARSMYPDQPVDGQLIYL